MGKKGKGGPKSSQKSSQSIKLKPNKNVFKVKFQGKAKQRKSHSKAVKTELKKMSMDSAKKIQMLNADHNKIVTTPMIKPKPTTASTSGVTKRKPVEDLPDVGGVTSIFATL